MMVLSLVLLCGVRVALGMFTFVDWNAQYADIERLHDLSEEFKYTDVVAVTSTGERATPDRSATFSNLKHHFVVRCGCLAGRHVNKSCGIALLLRKRVFKQRDVYDVPSVPAALQG
eukprot:8726007-Pyramimonas_sp.AAC.1